MKWFKHFSDASNDEFVSELEDIFGLEGYARWFKLIEVISSQYNQKKNKASASYSWKKWQTFLKGKRNKLETFLKHLENKQKIKLKQTENILEIEIPKLLELKDNYTKDLEVADKKLSNHKEVEVYKEEEEREVKQKQKIFSSDSNEIRLSHFLFNHMLKNDPNLESKKPNFQTWAKAFDKLIRIDKREIEEIKQVIIWSQNNDFWKSNILSASKLRNKFQTLRLQMNKTSPVQFKTRAEREAEVEKQWLSNANPSNEKIIQGKQLWIETQ